MTAVFGPIERLSTHVLDTALGRPAAGIPVNLYAVADSDPAIALGAGVTDADGRIAQLNSEALGTGNFRMIFDTAAYFTHQHGRLFYSRITVEFFLDGARAHYHLPVLASPYSYTTHLGS